MLAPLIVTEIIGATAHASDEKCDTVSLLQTTGLKREKRDQPQNGERPTHALRPGQGCGDM